MGGVCVIDKKGSGLFVSRGTLWPGKRIKQRLDHNSGTRNPTRGYVASRYSLLAYAWGDGVITAGIRQVYDQGLKQAGPACPVDRFLKLTVCSSWLNYPDCPAIPASVAPIQVENGRAR